MTKRISITTILAASTLLACPAFAQTTAPAHTAATPPAMTRNHPITSGTTTNTGTSANAATSADVGTSADSGKFFTADHQIRSSKVVGADVYNDRNQSVGSIDDLLMSDNDHKAATVVISVGGFLGMGSKLVTVPFDQLKIENNKIVMPGATKASLEGMPAYHYGNA